MAEVQSPGALQPLLPPASVLRGQEGDQAGQRGDHPAQQAEQLQQVKGKIFLLKTPSSRSWESLKVLTPHFRIAI